MKRFSLNMMTLLATLLVIACGKKSVDPEFNPYIEEFLAAGEARNRTIVIDSNIAFTDDLGPGKAGRCSENGIQIVKSLWQNSDEATRRAVIFHELGHCVLKRNHSMELMEHKPTSIMYPYYTPVAESLTINQDAYWDELFK